MKSKSISAQGSSTFACVQVQQRLLQRVEPEIHIFAG
jgi:hypothetical protein